MLKHLSILHKVSTCSAGMNYKQDDVNDFSLRRALINCVCCKLSQRVIIQLWEKISTREKNDLHGVA